MQQTWESIADDAMCAALRAVPQELPWPAASADMWAQFVTRAQIHGVASLLYRHRATAWPRNVQDAFRAAALERAAWECRHQAVVRRVLDAFAAAGIECLLLKGTATAYSLYPDAALRERGDTDMFVGEASRAPATRALEAIGFCPVEPSTGQNEASFELRLPEGTSHIVDLHWQISNSQVLSSLFQFGELQARRIGIPALGPNAFAPALATHLLITIFHRARHTHSPYYLRGKAHYAGDRLIWLHDVHLLACACAPPDWEAFVDEASAKGLARVAAQMLHESAARFDTAVPDSVMGRLEASPSRTLAQRYLAASRLDRMRMDWRAARTWHARWRFAHDALFPGADYMRSRYPGSRAPLPWLYLRRAAGALLPSAPAPADQKISIFAAALKSLQRIARLPAVDRAVVLQTLVAFPLAWLAIRLVAPRRLESLVPLRRLNDAPPGDAHIRRVCALVNGTSNRLSRGGNCLPRSLVAVWLLRRRGVDGKMRIGVARIAGALQVHAWVEVAEAAVNDTPDVQSRYATLSAQSPHPESVP